MLLSQTPSQTVGPYFAYGLTPEQYLYDFKSLADNVLINDKTEADPITIVGKVLDGNGAVIPDAMIELWQTDIQGFGRFGTGTTAENTFVFKTTKPTSPDGQAPHISVIVFMRGLLVHAYTRLYFSDEMAANQSDIVLNSVPEDRRPTLIAQRKEQGGQVVYQFDIRMQGENETVFFDV